MANMQKFRRAAQVARNWESTEMRLLGAIDQRALREKSNAQVRNRETVGRMIRVGKDIVRCKRRTIA